MDKGRAARPRTSAGKRATSSSRPVMILNENRVDGFFIADQPARKRGSGSGAMAGAVYGLMGLGA